MSKNAFDACPHAIFDNLENQVSLLQNIQIFSTYFGTWWNPAICATFHRWRKKSNNSQGFFDEKNHPPLWPLAAIVKGQGCHLFSAMSPCLRRNFALLEVCHLNHWWNTCCPRCREADWYHYLWFLSRFADSHKSQGNCYEKTSENHGEVPSNLVQEQKKMFGIILKARKSISKVTLLGVQWPCSCYGKAFPRWAPLSYK